MLSGLWTRCCASHSPVTRTHGGELRRPRSRARSPAERRGREVRRVGLDQQPLPGDEPRDLRGGLFPATEHETAERDGQPELQRGLGVVDGSGEGVQHRGRTIPEGGPGRRSPEAGRSQLRQERILPVTAPGRGTAVQDRRLGRVESQAQVAPQVCELRLRRECMRSKSRPVSPIATAR